MTEDELTTYLTNRISHTNTPLIAIPTLLDMLYYVHPWYWLSRNEPITWDEFVGWYLLMSGGDDEQ